MRITVLGGTGFIGPYVVRQLAEAGHEVTVVHRGEHEPDLGVEVRHVHTPRSGLAGAMAEIGDADVAVDMFAFTEADAQLALDALRGHAPRLVAVSSCDVYRVYGAINGLEESPLPEPPVTEDSPLRSVLYPLRDGVPEGGPAWLREYDKIPIERLVLGDDAVAGTVCRLCAVHGPGDGQHRMLDLVARIDDGRRTILLEQILAGCLWPHGYVEDVAAAIALCATSERASGRVYNVGPLRTLSFAEWARAVGNALGWDGEILVVPDGSLNDEPGGDMRHDMNLVSARIRQELGYAEPVPFDEGVRRTAEWERKARAAGAGPTAESYAREDAAAALIR